MTDPRAERPTPTRASTEQRQVTRRALLQALGFGTVAGAGRMRSTTAQGTPESERSVSGSRTPAGPNVEDMLWDLEYDVERIFRFVADDVAYEAYSGALRGAKGAYWGLAGNSVDQAILLADLLTHAQVSVRFAVGELDNDEADKLLDSTRIDAATARAQAQKLGAGDRADFDHYPGLTLEQRSTLQSPEGLRALLVERASARLDEGLTTIQAALASEAVELPDPEFSLPDRERRQHLWVQYAAGPEWIDLDPSFPDAEPGRAYARQTETWDAIPVELFHRVQFRAVVEKIAGGQAVREDSFVHGARAADLVGVPVVVAHVDPNALRDLGVSIAGFIEGTTQFVPSLLAGEAGETGNPVTIGVGEGALDVLGTSGSEGEAIAEWLEIEVSPVDAPSRIVTREVFDRIGIDRRATGAVDLASLAPVELTDTPELGQTFLPLEAVWLIGVVGGRIPASYFAQDYAIEDVEADMAVLVHGYHAARDALQIEIAADRGYRWYHNEPNLTAARVAPVAVAADQFRISAALDILHQGYGVVPLAGATPAVHPLVLAGVLAHVAERAGADAGAELSPEAPPPAGSVAQVFEEAARAGVSIRTLTPQSNDLANLAVSGAAKARIAEALAAGYVVVVPERAITLNGIEAVGWWQVDPQSGRTFDLMENGTGGSPMGEETVIIAGGPAWRAATAWKILSFVIGIIVGFSAVMAILMYPN